MLNEGRVEAKIDWEGEDNVMPSQALGERHNKLVPTLLSNVMVMYNTGDL